MVSDLVAVIAHPDSPPVTSSEIEVLAKQHERLRGPSPRTFLGCGRARVALLNGTAEKQPQGEAPSWVAVAGVLHGPQVWDDRHVERVRSSDGQFSLVSYDAAADEVLVANDPLGMAPLYVADAGGRTYVSTSALILASFLGCTVSALGVQSFLASGYQFGSRTSWNDVERLDPATCVRFGRQKVLRETYWRPTIDSGLRGRSLQDEARRSLHVLEGTLRSYLSGRDYCADLTGGFDSRLLTLALQAAGVPFCTNTRSVSTPDDVEIAQDIARRKGWEWHCLPLPSDWPLRVSELLPTALGWGDGQLDVLQLARVLFRHEQLATHREDLLCSAGGEHFERNWESEFLRAGHSRDFNTDRWVEMIALKQGDADLLREGAGGDVRSDLRTRARRWLEPYADELNTTKLELLHAYKSTGHGGAYRAADGAYIRTQLPYYFTPIFTTAISLSYRHRNGHRMHREMITALDKEIAGIRTTHGGPALPWRAWRPDRQAPYAAAIARKAASKLGGGRGARWSRPPGMFAWQQAAHGAVLNELGKAGLLDWREMRTAPLLRRERFQDLVERSLSPGFTEHSLLGRVITAEMSLRATDTAIG